MIELFAVLVILTIINRGSCELNTTLSGYEVTEEGGEIPVADVIEPGWGQEPMQSPDRFLNRPGKHRIIGGDKTDIELYPFMVSIRMFDEHICGASYINTEWVLTAAHCLRIGINQNHHRVIESMVVKMGSADLSAKDAQSRKIEKVFTHEKYNPKTDINDIGLLKIDKPFDLGPKIKTVVLQTVARNFDNVTCSVVGWGVTNEKDSTNPEAVSKFLLKVDLPIVNVRDCEKHYRGMNISVLVKADSIICAGMQKGKDACQGDSGGPLVCDNIQVGIVSWGIGCGRPLPGIFTKVYHHIPWINSQIKGYRAIRSGNISFKCSEYMIILGVVINVIN